MSGVVTLVRGQVSRYISIGRAHPVAHSPLWGLIVPPLQSRNHKRTTSILSRLVWSLLRLSGWLYHGPLLSFRHALQGFSLSTWRPNAVEEVR